jgi:hypothetical protein
MRNYRKLTAGLTAAWLIVVLCASALQMFRNDSNQFGLPIAVSAVTPIVVFGIWFAMSDTFRRFALSLNPRTLTFVQAWRIFGFVFVVLEARGVLPAIFALPAGYGDMAIGATASIVALTLARPNHRTAFITWHALGMADLLMAVGLGTTARLLSSEGASMAAMTVLPLSLVPTFIVPLLFILHIICIARAMQWRVAPGDLSLETNPAAGSEQAFYQTR